MGLFSSIGSIAGGFFGGPAGAAAGGALGGALDGAQGQRDQRQAISRSEQFAKYQFDKNAELQKEFAQHGIRWKVADAKAAGLHPLYAVGASTSSAMPITVGSPDYSTSRSDYGTDSLANFFSQSGQQNSRSALSDEQKLEQQLRIAELSSRVKKDDAIAAYYASLAGTERQKQMWGSAPSQTGSPTGAIQFKPDEVVSADPQNPSLVAGKHPTMTRYNIGGGNVELPYSSEGPAESLENPALFPFIAGYNAMRLVPERVWDSIVENKKRSMSNRRFAPPVRPATQRRLRQQW